MFSILDLLLTGLAAALWYVRPELAAWPLLPVAAGVACRWLARPQAAVWRRGPFNAPLALFLAAALLGAVWAYAPAPAWAKLWTIAGGVALYGSVAGAAAQVRIGRWQIAPVSVVLALFPAVLAAYFLLTNDWAHWAGKLAWLDPITAWLATWQPDLPGHRLHPNVAGGLLAGLLPLQIAAVRRTRAGWALVAFALLALVLTASRGAWLALGVAGAGWLVGWRWRSRGGAAQTRLLLWGGVGVLAALALLPWLLLAAGLADPVMARISLLRDGVTLALDTPFTGLGLAGFQMAFSTYVLLLHVGHTYHSHNLFLNIWLEQGLLGLAAWGWLLAAAARYLTRSPRLSQVDAAPFDSRLPSTAHCGAPLRMPSAQGVSASDTGKREEGAWIAAGLAALAVIVLHGLVDDAFYGSRGVLLLFLPFAVLARIDGTRMHAAGRGWRRRQGPVGMAAAAVLLLLALLPGTRAAMQANLAALSQTRAELSAYNWPDTPIQDALRRQAPSAPPPVNLAPAIARYRAALALDPGNVTANRRLGQIELARGEAEAARGHLEAAYAAAPWQRATRQLLGEALALAGRTGEAAALWRTVDLSSGQLEGRIWWYQALGEDEAVAQMQAAQEKTR